MEPLTRHTLRGSWSTLLLPIQSDDRIDYSCLQDELDYITRVGVSGVYTNGTAGEFFNQTEDEFDKISALTAEICHKTSIPFQIGASHMSPIISLERIIRTKSLGPGAYQIILPDWVATTRQEQLSFLNRMAEAAAPVPLVLYNPGHAKAVLNPEDFAQLADAVPALIGIKVAAGGPDWYSTMRTLEIPLAVFVPGHRLATGIKEGVGVGAYSNVACLNPLAAQQWYQMMREDLDEALRLERRIGAFFEQCILPYYSAGYSDMALDKYLAAVGGWTDIGTRLRWPYRWIDRKDVQKARTMGRNLIPEFFDE
ncbi:dihydrodipicolinate synthase family protein [Nibrella saemangeumensis]|uniref:Dihydrodipicolinate synthase family protein n=1 Tax=Nibrella saemangeumensis TaxID=1084526 RepID=A0ABP8NBU1_9BACT